MTETASDTVFATTYAVSFGDCDPVGIVYYPNFFAWLDRTFHSYLREVAGGHTAVCAALSAFGTGLISAECQFRKPVKEGDDLVVEIAAIEWGERSFIVKYNGRIGEMLAFQGEEKRALFIEENGRIKAGEVAPLKARLEEGTHD